MARRRASGFAIHDKTWPLLIVRAPARTDAALAHELMAQLDPMLDRTESVALLLDLGDVTRPELQLLRVVDAIRQRANSDVAAMAIIAPSPVVRTAIGFVLRVRPAGFPIEISTDTGSANAFVAPFIADKLRVRRAG